MSRVAFFCLLVSLPATARADEVERDNGATVAAELFAGWSAEGDVGIGLELGELLGISGYVGVGIHELVLPQFTVQFRFRPPTLTHGAIQLHTGLGATIGTLRANGSAEVERIWVPRMCLPHTNCASNYDAYRASINPYRMRADPGVWLSPEIGFAARVGPYFEPIFFVGWT